MGLGHSEWGRVTHATIQKWDQSSSRGHWPGDSELSRDSWLENYLVYIYLFIFIYLSFYFVRFFFSFCHPHLDQPNYGWEYSLTFTCNLLVNTINCITPLVMLPLKQTNLMLMKFDSVHVNLMWLFISCMHWPNAGVCLNANIQCTRGRISFQFARIKILCDSCIYYIIQWEKLILI